MLAWNLMELGVTLVRSEALLLAQLMNIDHVCVVESLTWCGRIHVNSKVPGLKSSKAGRNCLDGKRQFDEGSSGTFENLSLTNDNNVLAALIVVFK